MPDAQKFYLIDQRRRDNAKAAIDAAVDGQEVIIRDGKRSLDQNALLHMWMGEVAKQRDGMTLMDVKAEANYEYGIPILRADDPAYSWFIDRLNLPYDKMLKAIKKGLVPCTSLMTKPQLTQYLDAFGRDMRQEGYALTDPELIKYRGEQ
jgi:hypothetical protein